MATTGPAYERWPSEDGSADPYPVRVTPTAAATAGPAQHPKSPPATTRTAIRGPPRRTPPAPPQPPGQATRCRPQPCQNGPHGGARQQHVRRCAQGGGSEHAPSTRPLVERRDPPDDEAEHCFERRSRSARRVAGPAKFFTWRRSNHVVDTRGKESKRQEVRASWRDGNPGFRPGPRARPFRGRPPARPPVRCPRSRRAPPAGHSRP